MFTLMVSVDLDKGPEDQPLKIIICSKDDSRQLGEWQGTIGAFLRCLATNADVEVGPSFERN